MGQLVQNIHCVYLNLTSRHKRHPRFNLRNKTLIFLKHPAKAFFEKTICMRVVSVWILFLFTYKLTTWEELCIKSIMGESASCLELSLGLYYQQRNVRKCKCNRAYYEYVFPQLTTGVRIEKFWSIDHWSSWPLSRHYFLYEFTDFILMKWINL